MRSRKFGMLFCLVMFSKLSATFLSVTLRKSIIFNTRCMTKWSQLPTTYGSQKSERCRRRHLLGQAFFCAEGSNELDCSNAIEDFDTENIGGGIAQPGTVYFVATPIGNMGDITLRAVSILKTVDVVASEDTRRTGRLLQSIKAGKKVQLSHHEHNWKERVPELIALAQAGKSIAVVSDAGTPGISDPGVPLAKACGEQGIQVVPIPGPCAAVAALSVSGHFSSEFVFFGFLPAKKGSQRTNKLRQVAEEPRTCVFYEAPHRIQRTLQELEELSEEVQEREIFLAKEITKVHEYFFRGTISTALKMLQNSAALPKGEFSVVLGPAEQKKESTEEQVKNVQEKLKILLCEENMSISMAVKIIAQDMKNLKKNDIYRIALETSQQKKS